ncbi:MAG: TIGR01906 family membrane protein [Dehalococcoidia bacterium]|nr:TIGR01906 family membrane protein [Dehalococcoidia bacterium]
MALLSRLAMICFVAAVPVLLVTTNVRFFAGEERFYERGFRNHDADQVTGVSLAELDRAAREIIAYFENDAETLRILVTRDGQEISLFNSRETEHMKDVKWLMQAVFGVQEVALAYVLAYVTGVFLWARERSLRSLAKLALLGVAAGFAVVAAVGALAVTGFDALWTRFHEIAFRNDLWELDPDTDRLIQMFPEEFWQESTYIIGAMTLGEVAAIVIAATAYLVFARDGAPAPDVRARGRSRAAGEPGPAEPALPPADTRDQDDEQD